MSILTAKDAIKGSPDFINFISKHLLPTLQEYLKEIDQYKFGVRLLRLFKFMVQNLQIGLVPLLESMVNSIESKDWIQRINFELFNELFTDSNIVSIILSNKDLLSFLEV